MRMKIMMAAAVAAGLLSTSAFAQDGTGRKFTIPLDGQQVTFGGDPDGSGTATLRVNPGRGEICYTLTVHGIEPATAAHIHEGPAGGNGPVVVQFAAPTSGSSSSCTSVSRELAQGIVQSPSEYYVAVHNAPYPAGALRGQLDR